MTTLALKDVSVEYGSIPALDNFSLEINDGEFVALLGPSGSGKTTALKVIAGLLVPNTGDVRFNDASVLKLPAERRNAAMVFQKPLLFPYLTVAENIAFGLKMRGLGGEEIASSVAEALQWVQMEGYERRKPNELSGGQEQRVALARALVTNPQVLLLDEPFSALDENLRIEMRMLVRELQRHLKITTVFVTHDQREAMAIADRIALLHGGRIEQYDRPNELLLNPRTIRAAQFFGWKILTVERRNDTIRTEVGDFNISQEPGGDMLCLAFRPENVRLRQNEIPNGHPILDGVLASLLDYGTRWQWRVQLTNGETIENEQEHGPDERPPELGRRVQLHLPENALRYFHGK